MARKNDQMPKFYQRKGANHVMILIRLDVYEMKGKMIQKIRPHKYQL